MAGTSGATTRFALLPGHDERKHFVPAFPHIQLPDKPIARLVGDEVRKKIPDVTGN
jgi:hypothetical protein